MKQPYDALIQSYLDHIPKLPNTPDGDDKREQMRDEIERLRELQQGIAA